MPLIHRPDINRLLAAFDHCRADRVPNFEIWIGPRSVSHILGYETDCDLWTLEVAEAMKVAEAIGQDAIAASLTWMHSPDGSILTRGDAEAIKIPDPSLARKKLQNYIENLSGSDIGLCARISGPLTLSYMALGPVPIESFMYLLYDDLELVEYMMDMFLNYHLGVIEAVADIDFHFFYIGDDLSSSTGPMVSPQILGKLWAPRTEKLVKAAKATGKPVMFHCCGAQEPILPYLVKWGVNATHPIQPGANDIYAIHKQYGDKLTLIGNIDVAGLLSFGKPEEVYADTCEHIEKLGKDGGYVVCSSHSIIDSVPPENFLAMVKATHEYGIYK